MKDQRTYTGHPGLTLGALSAAQPLFAFLFGDAGAVAIRSACRTYLAEGSDPEEALAILDEVDSIRPPIAIDAAGFLDLLLPDTAPAHVRWNAFFYGACASEHHASIAAAICAATGHPALAEALENWCDPVLGRDLNRAINAAEMRCLDDDLDETDRALIPRFLITAGGGDLTHPIYIPIIELIRIAHVRQLLDQLAPDARADVVARLRKVTA